MKLARQRNARLPTAPGIQVRAGIPHKGGQLAVACWERDYAAMVSAAAFWNEAKGELVPPDISPLHDLDIALDSAGFTAMAQFARRGATTGIANIYPWSLSSYLELATWFGGSLAWFSQPDFCCEPEIARDAETRSWRVRATATLLELTLRTVATWQQQFYARARVAGASPTSCERMTRDFLLPPTPVLQGWDCDDYRFSIELFQQVWERWDPLYECVLVGVGSVCRRDLRHPTHGIEAILRVIDDELPRGIKLHLFGAKGAVVRALEGHPRVVSIDSMAYDFRARVLAREARMSNTMAHRISVLDDWMKRQTEHGSVGQKLRRRGARAS